uniref:Potassium channel toxin meuK3-1-b n=1 Tax=Mesobuthus eupeus TaxID=34648 RepID=A0A143MH63_MESEU|nr:potassium channel toxin meuK3-1-b [Mesobuthus eupeus]
MNRLCKITVMIVAFSAIMAIISETNVAALSCHVFFDCYFGCLFKGHVGGICKKEEGCVCSIKFETMIEKIKQKL